MGSYQHIDSKCKQSLDEPMPGVPAGFCGLPQEKPESGEMGPHPPDVFGRCICSEIPEYVTAPPRDGDIISNNSAMMIKQKTSQSVAWERHADRTNDQFYFTQRSQNRS